MHGTAFYVMGMGRNHNGSSINWKMVREMDMKNLLNRWFEKPVKKDTVVIPYNGYVVLRFLADNPGKFFGKNLLIRKNVIENYRSLKAKFESIS